MSCVNIKQVALVNDQMHSPLLTPYTIPLLTSNSFREAYWASENNWRHNAIRRAKLFLF